MAIEFIESGWSLKALHRLMLTSETYQLSSQHCDESFAVDGDNRLLWRFSPRRMDIEAWRDSLVSLTDDLDPALGGPPIADIANSNRRTLYAKVSRNGDQFASDEFLRRFDFPIMRATVAQRPSSIVPQQYLFMLNSEFMVTRAPRLAADLAEQGETPAERIVAAYRLLFQRPPRPEELQLGIEFLSSATAADAKLSSWERYAQV